MTCVTSVTGPFAADATQTSDVRRMGLERGRAPVAFRRARFEEKADTSDQSERLGKGFRP